MNTQDSTADMVQAVQTGVAAFLARKAEPLRGCLRQLPWIQRTAPA